MALRTTFTDLIGTELPIVLAPMGGSAGGALASAVSNGGGLGMVGAGRGDPDWLSRELALVTAATERPWGVGFLTWAATGSALQQALEHGPHAVLLSFGDPGPLADLVRAAGVRLLLQVTDLDEARQAVGLGADVIVAQGAEAGGHSGRGRATLPFVPAVVDLAGTIPVVAAGGIADGRGIAAVLALGAAGAMLGTRFLVSPEALVDPADVRAVVEGSGDDTERSRIPDIARGAAWPARYPARVLRNAFLDDWRGREAELERDQTARARYREAEAARDLSVATVWAGQGIDLITEPVPAEALVRRLGADAEATLRRAGAGVGSVRPPTSGEVAGEDRRAQHEVMHGTDAGDDATPARWSAATQRPDLWVDPDADPRMVIPAAVDERTTVCSYLAGYRLTMEMKCAGLGPHQLARRSVPPSSMSLLGLVRHMAGVEHYWFRQVMAGDHSPRPFRSGGDANAEWNGAVADPEVVAEAWRAWREEVGFAQRFVDEAEDLGMTGTQPNGSPVQLRDVLVHMVEEYARHCGHADLLRERIDGRVGQ